MPRRWSLRRTGVSVLLALSALLAAQSARAQDFTHSAVILRDGDPTLIVDGQPFFFYGAAFFYERIPAAQWRESMLALRRMGFNTLDLYVPWNWHEPDDGNFDFEGRTNPRRNLRAVLALARELDFKLIVRPGPVIRNEWRNGGYPAWLLTRPEYGMPLHDVLEGRYPATATLQNANSDDAAAQWMDNSTHLRYARRWLQTVLREFAPVADRVLAVQLDDDQGAYIDNQTWPAPHLRAYLTLLERIVREIVGPQLPVFINTYEMKVTASSPVWAMGNWYQSDTYAIGEHDRTALEFSTGLLQTQAHFPVAISEFQAGWLAQPQEPSPRPADPANTTLALHTLLGMGMHGAIDFPAQDTVNPAGWEAPFANMHYAWDAALDMDLAPSARYDPTARFGQLVREYGPQLASTRRLADGAIAYLTSAYDADRIANADIFAIAARTQTAQQDCRRRRLTCDLIDLRYISDAALGGYAFVIVAEPPGAPAMIETVAARLRRYRSGGGRVIATAPAVAAPRNGGIADATVLASAAAGAPAFLDVVNYDDRPRSIPAARIALPGGAAVDVAPFTLAARDAVLVPLRPGEIATPPPLLPVNRPTARTCLTDPPPPVDAADVAVDDRAADGFARVSLSNGEISVTLAPAAGARAFWFGAPGDERCASNNVFTTVGALRDDVEIQPPLSTTDRIGKYTRSFPAGTFNRTYLVDKTVADSRTATATLSYDAPDVVPHGAHFERTIALLRGEHAFTVTQRVVFGAGPDAERQRAVRYDSFDSRAMTVIDERSGGAVGFFSPAAQSVTVLCWPKGDVEDAQLIPERTSTVVRLRFAPDVASRTRYALDPARSTAEAREMLLKERDSVAANR